MDKLNLTVVLMKPAAKSPAEALRKRQGDKIRAHRILPRPGFPHGWPQAHLAAMVGVTKAAVSEWEQGKSTPRPHHQVLLAKSFQAPWSSLFGLDGEAA